LEAAEAKLGLEPPTGASASERLESLEAAIADLEREALSAIEN